MSARIARSLRDAITALLAVWRTAGERTKAIDLQLARVARSVWRS